jgi:hypothetical protein
MKTAKQNAGVALIRAALAHSDCYNAGDYDGLAGCLARAELELAVDAYRDAKPEPAVGVTLTADATQAIAQLDEVLWRLTEIQRIADAFDVPVEMLAGPVRVPGGYQPGGYYYVKVSDQLVAQLREAPSNPVVIAEIGERATEHGTELELIMRTHECDTSGNRTPYETFVLAAATAWYHAYNAIADGTETRRARDLASSIGRMLDADSRKVVHGFD